MPTTTLILKRPENPNGIKRVAVTWNGHIKHHWSGSYLQPTRRFLWEMGPEERAARLAELGRIHE